VGGQRGIESVGRDAPAPEVVGRLGHPARVVGRELGVQRHAGGEGGVGEGALAEAVDGEDRRLVEGGEGELERARERRVVGTAHAAHALEQARDEVVARGRRAAAFRTQHGEGVDDALADALAQFGGGGIREGDDQDARHLEPALEQ